VLFLYQIISTKIPELEKRSSAERSDAVRGEDEPFRRGSLKHSAKTAHMVRKSLIYQKKC